MPGAKLWRLSYDLPLKAGRGRGSEDMSWKLFRSIYGVGEPVQLSISCTVRQRQTISTRLQVVLAGAGQRLITCQSSHSQALVAHPLWYSKTPPPKWFTTSSLVLPHPPFPIRFIRISNSRNLSNTPLQSTCVGTRAHSTLPTHHWRACNDGLIDRHCGCWRQQRRTYAKKGGMVI